MIWNSFKDWENDEQNLFVELLYLKLCWKGKNKSYMSNGLQKTEWWVWDICSQFQQIYVFKNISSSDSWEY